MFAWRKGEMTIQFRVPRFCVSRRLRAIADRFGFCRREWRKGAFAVGVEVTNVDRAA